MANVLLPLCSSQKIATRDGQTGALARLLLPFFGYWYASGQQFAFPNSTIAQDRSRTLNGTSKPSTFVKTPGVCSVNV
jgi:hypothetical protein